MEIRTYDVGPIPQPVTNKRLNTARIVVPLILSFSAGTGGAMTTEGVENLAQWVYTPDIHIESISNHVEIRTPAELVAAVRKLFDLNMSELASLLNVSRPTVYAWLNGQEPSSESVHKIQRLALYADELKALKARGVGKLVRRPIFGTQSLIDRLKSGENPLDALVVIKEIAEKEAQSRRRTKGSGKPRRSMSEIGDSYSSSLHDEA